MRFPNEIKLGVFLGGGGSSNFQGIIGQNVRSPESSIFINSFLNLSILHLPKFYRGSVAFMISMNIRRGFVCNKSSVIFDLFPT